MPGAVCQNAQWDIIQNLWVGDPNTTSMTPTSQTANNLHIRRIGGKFTDGFMRHVSPTGGGNTQFVEWTDQQSQSSLTYSNITAAYPKVAYIAAIAPVTRATSTPTRWHSGPGLTSAWVWF